MTCTWTWEAAYFRHLIYDSWLFLANLVNGHYLNTMLEELDIEADRPPGRSASERLLVILFIGLIVVAIAATPVYVLIKQVQTDKVHTATPPLSPRSSSVVTEHGAVTAFSHTCR